MRIQERRRLATTHHNIYYCMYLHNCYICMYTCTNSLSHWGSERLLCCGSISLYIHVHVGHVRSKYSHVPTYQGFMHDFLEGDGWVGLHVTVHVHIYVEQPTQPTEQHIHVHVWQYMYIGLPSLLLNATCNSLDTLCPSSHLYIDKHTCISSNWR